MTDAARVRTRRRGLETEGSAPVAAAPVAGQPTNDMHEKARKAFFENRKKNAATNGEKTARKELYALMKDGRVESFNTDATLESGLSVKLDVIVGQGVETYVDINELYALVDMPTFLKIVGATQEAVEAHAGKSVLTRCVKTRLREENVTVKAAK